VIKESFLSILIGVYHSRIEYPDDEKSTKEIEESSQTKNKIT
jgi:hypothetical protein